MPTDHRLLVVANRTCPCPGLTEEIAQRSPSEVLVVAPALNSRLRHFLTDDRAAVAAAKERLHVAVELLRDAGIHARGEIGDADPLHALEDAHASFKAHAVLLSTWPEGASHWLERNLVERARNALPIPVEHVWSRWDLPAVVEAPSMLTAA